MATSYIELVNKLRNRFNEPRMTMSTWNTAVGFDQYCKEAVNYAYHDILNAEMEWPFCHRETTFLSVPGVNRYIIETADEFKVKEIDWGSFYLNLNKVSNTINAEFHVIATSTPFIVIPTSFNTWGSDLGVKYDPSGIDLTPVDYDPKQAGEYTIRDTVYYFHSDDSGVAVRISYTTALNSTINVNDVQFLMYQSYDHWRQTCLVSDLAAIRFNSYSQPMRVYKTQRQGEIGLSPPPDKIYSVAFEYWLDADDMVNTSDTTVIPARFEQVLLDGAAKYLYDFREDTPLAKSTGDRFQAGIIRMRTELINRDMDFRSGFHWGGSPWAIGGTTAGTANAPAASGGGGSGGGGSSDASVILLEQGGELLLEQGGEILLEQ